MNNQDEIKIESKTFLNDQEQEVKIDNMSDQDKNKNGLGEKWPEPIVRVQSLAESNLTTLPDRYIKPPSQRPQTTIIDHQPEVAGINIPIIDLDNLFSRNEDEKKRMSEACREWGFFQVRMALDFFGSFLIIFSLLFLFEDSWLGLKFWTKKIKIVTFNYFQTCIFSMTNY